MEKRWISPSVNHGRMIKGQMPGNDLVQDNITATHILSIHGTEKMPRTIAKTLMSVIILNDVTDVHHIMRTAPVTKQPAEISAIRF